MQTTNERLSDLKIYTSSACGPCKDVSEALEVKGQLILLTKDGEKVVPIDLLDVVDVDTSEGSEDFFEKVLANEDGAVPSAYREGAKCIIGFNDEGTVVVDCSQVAPLASQSK